MMYEQIRQEIKHDYYLHNYSNEGQRFVAWYLRNIHLRDPNQAKDEITDGPDDKQIDAIVIDDDRSAIFIVQSKFLGSDSVGAEPLREVLASWLQLRDLTRLQEVANEKLKRKLAEVAKALEDDYEINFELLTTAALTAAAEQDLATFQKQLADLSERDEFPAAIHLVDRDELRRRYDLALDRDNPSISHSVTLEQGKFVSLDIAGTSVVLAALPLRQCLDLPRIKDGTLFQKNVRQSLGLNKINKGIRSTIYSDKHRDFFFFHNGVTAICNRMKLDGVSLLLQGLSIVNGCQSLNTILSCSERVKTLPHTYIMFRFYEIPQRDRADKISIFTNSQTAVKPRDLRSNDKRVLNLKNSYKQKYPHGYLKTKRGEDAPADADPRLVVDLSDLGKYLLSWHSQRPNIAYNESKIFDKYFEQLFKREYKPEKAYGLNIWMGEVMETWSASNPLQLNETLLAMRAYAPFHQLYAVSICFAITSNRSDMVPNPFVCLESAQRKGMVSEIVKIAGTCLNMALEAAANEPQPQNRVFSPHNWIKAKQSLTGVNFAIRNYFNMLPMMPGGREIASRLQESLTIPQEEFEYRWAAD
jgi:AIPR protein